MNGQDVRNPFEQLDIEQFTWQEDATCNSENMAVAIGDALTEVVRNERFTQYIGVTVNSDNTVSIRAKTILIAKVKLHGQKRYMEVQNKYMSFFVGTNGQSVEERGTWSRISVKNLEDVLDLMQQLSEVYMLVLSELGGESFGCCARYIECSDAGKCVHPDYFTSLACLYKRNLDNGRVFYGKNQNN